MVSLIFFLNVKRKRHLNLVLIFNVQFSGGYNIKTGAGCMIELMKFDMGGSAAVLGAAKALGQIKPDGVEVDFLFLDAFLYVLYA